MAASASRISATDSEGIKGKPVIPGLEKSLPTNEKYFTSYKMGVKNEFCKNIRRKEDIDSG